MEHPIANSPEAEIQRLEAAIANGNSENEHATLHLKIAQIHIVHLEHWGIHDEVLKHLWAGWQIEPDNLDIQTLLIKFLN